MVADTLDLDLIRVHAGDAEGGVVEAEQLSTAQTTFAATPLVEVGMNDRLSPTLTLRSFASLGVSAPSNDRWQQEIRFAACTPGVVNAGLQLFTGGAVRPASRLPSTMT